MKALSIRAPLWWYILNGGMDIVNSDWPTCVRGRVLIHAGKWWNEREVAEAIGEANQMEVAAAAMRAALGEDDIGFSHLNLAALRSGLLRDSGGCLVGSVEIVDCVAQSGSPWFAGEYGFVLQKPVTFAKPLPWKGALGFFSVDDAVAEDLRK